MQTPTGEAEIGLEAKVAFLSRRDSYPEAPSRVEARQTHMSWVFIGDRFVYKLKKPVKHDFLDFSSCEKRRFFCEESLRLDRRLAPDVYLEVLPLTRRAGGGLGLGGDGEPVDWLVKMRRLPDALMLDAALRDGRVRAEQIRSVTSVLSAFYRGAEPVPMDGAEYRSRLRDAVQSACDGLGAKRYGLSPAVVAGPRGQLLRRLDDDPSLFDARVAAGRIVEAHGDLRPEHVCLSTPPVVIDCLEFARELRILDIAHELAYLDLECVYLGAAFVGEVLFETYRGQTGDRVPIALRDFYRAYRGLLRARLALAHLDDHDAPGHARWRSSAGRYLALAAEFAARI